MATIMNVSYRNVNTIGDRATRRPVKVAIRAALARAFDAVLTWQERERQRRHLMELDDRLLKDIGVSRFDAQREYEKPFWRP